MAEIATVARPYAEAAFKSARDRNALEAVAHSLALLAAIERDERIRSALSDPRLSAERKKQLISDVAGRDLDEISRNLAGLLIDNQRDELLGAIAEQFDALRREHERVLRAHITSAQPLTGAQRADIVAALEKRYGKKVEADVEVDPELLGGARVQIGDQVIHASVRDALGQMAAALAR